ncbi:PAS domain S-box protein [Trinickia sp. YCB016]
MNEVPKTSITDAIQDELERQNAALREDRDELQRLVAQRTENLSLTSFALSQVREAVYLIAEDARFVYVNEEACRALGYGLDELLQMTVMDIDPGWDKQRWDESWHETRGPGPHFIESAHRRKDGSTFPVEIRANYFEYLGKRYDLALVSDITERMDARERLHASEQAFRAVVEHARDYIARYDLELRRVYVNPALLALMQLPSSEVLGTTPSELSSFADARRYLAALRQVAETGQEVTDEVCLRDAAGQMRWGHMRIVPEFAPDGSVASVLAICRDIDELKRSESAFRTLAENAPDPIIRYDRDCRRTYVNPEFERVSGMCAGELLGEKAGHQVPYAPAAVVEEFRAQVKAIFDTGVAAKLEVIWERDGKPQCWSVHAVPECGADGGIQSVLTVWRDITERKAGEQRLRESYELLRELASRRETAREDERKRIARELHDELGQHLTALRLGASAVRMQFGQDNPALAEHMQTMLALTDETMQVVRDVVASLRPAVLDAGIGAALEWLAAEFSRNARIPCRLCAPQTSVVLSEERATALFRIVQEALTNVARHADATEVCITLERRGGECFLEVRDDGRGFDPEAPHRKSFGLAGMKERVLMLGGEIAVVSSPNRGTAINVRVPVAVPV